MHNHQKSLESFVSPIIDYIPYAPEHKKDRASVTTKNFDGEEYAVNTIEPITGPSAPSISPGLKIGS